MTGVTSGDKARHPFAWQRRAGLREGLACYEIDPADEQIRAGLIIASSSAVSLRSPRICPRAGCFLAADNSHNSQLCDRGRTRED